jgi:hypothetical protein
MHAGVVGRSGLRDSEGWGEGWRVMEGWLKTIEVQQLVSWVWAFSEHSLAGFGALK